VCLLIVAWQVDDAYPLVVAANRDEQYARPARSMTVLAEGEPRILGGRDELAGGTWLAVNSLGVVAALTNRPTPGGRDPAKRSRGELPLMLAREASAEHAVTSLAARIDPGAYNPAWLLVGDRDSLLYAELTGAVLDFDRLAPGVHVLENAPLASGSAKVERVRSLIDAGDVGSLWTRLPSILADHVVPAGTGGQVEAGSRPPETLAACVHTERYGTRSAEMIRVATQRDRLPEVLVADGPACTAPFTDASHLWNEAAPAR
jgi:uncharacterized protein with NRDE domain